MTCYCFINFIVSAKKCQLCRFCTQKMQNRWNRLEMNQVDAFVLLLSIVVMLARNWKNWKKPTAYKTLNQVYAHNIYLMANMAAIAVLYYILKLILKHNTKQFQTMSESKISFNSLSEQLCHPLPQDIIIQAHFYVFKKHDGLQA